PAPAAPYPLSLHDALPISSSTSTTTGWATSPTTVATIVPGELAVPMVRNHDGPRARMWGTLERVSALLTRVGFDSSTWRCPGRADRKSTRLNSSHVSISYA